MFENVDMQHTHTHTHIHTYTHTDDRGLYYKLTNEPKRSCELKIDPRNEEICLRSCTNCLSSINTKNLQNTQSSNITGTRIAFKKASNGSLAYDLLSLINLQVKCNLRILRYNTDILMNSLGLKKIEYELCPFLSLFGLITLLFTLNHSTRCGYWSTRTFTLRSLESLALV